MMKFKIITTVVLVFNILNISAQTKYTFGGKITDSSNGEDLVGVTIYVNELKQGTVTNTYGFFSLTLPDGKYNITIRSIGFSDENIKIALTNNLTKNIELNPSSEVLDEVIIRAEKANKNVSRTQMSVETINIKQIKTIPVLMGEQDILKTIQLLPGISATSEGSTGFNVRGGSADQNLILLDEAPVYNAGHMMGFFSVFNSDALHDVQVYKGGIPANYGGRASSVIDVKMNNGNNKEFTAAGGIGIISSRLTLEGPIVKDKASFMIAGRRTYADLIVRQFEQFEGATLYFYDLNAKINYTINDKNRVFVSGYFGEDVFGFGPAGFRWGNITGTLRWNHVFGEKLFSNTSFIYSEYGYAFGIEQNDIDFKIGAGIDDMTFKQDYWFYLNPNNTLKFGFEAIKKTFLPGEISSDSDDNFDYLMDTKNSIESSLYLLNQHKIATNFHLNYGLRLNVFHSIGPETVYDYNLLNQITDSTVFGKNEVIKSYLSLEPRLALNYMFSDRSSVKLSFNRLAQNVHLLSNSTSGQPTDIWLPSSSVIKPQINNQIAIGYFRNFSDNMFEFSTELYYKKMDNVIDFENGTDILFNENIESQILHGDGRSYGLELYMKKDIGKVTGWISYTLSRTEHLFDNINNNSWFPAKYDKTHDVSIVASYHISKRINVSATWVYATGNAVTFPSGQYEINGNIIPYYTERNGYRMPDYHRLDLGVTLYNKERKKFRSNWNFSVYNVYNRYNAYSISFEESTTQVGTFDAVKLSLFGIVPSISYNFNF